MPKALILLLMGFILASCSSIKTFYGLADHFVQREAADHLDLSTQDKVVLAAQTAHLIAWHRNNMLPLYSTYFQTQARLIDRGSITRTDVIRSFAHARTLIEKTVAGFTPPAAIVLARHTAGPKLAHLEKRLNERMTKRMKRLERASEDRIKSRTKRLIRNFERLLVNLDDTQKAIIHRHATITVDDATRFMKHRAKRERAFINFMRNSAGAETIGPFLEKLLLRSYEIVEPDYKAFADRRAAEFQELIFAVISTFTPPQRAAAAKKLRAFAEDFSDLAEQKF